MAADEYLGLTQEESDQLDELKAQGTPFKATKEAGKLRVEKLQPVTTDFLANYDFAKMRDDGYSDRDILGALTSKFVLPFDVAKMQKDGYGDSDIVDAFIGLKKPPAKPMTAGDFTKEVGASAIDSFGYAAQAGGEILAKGLNTVFNTEFFRSANPLEGASKSMRESKTEGGKAAEQDQFEGDVIDALKGDFDKVKFPKTVSGLANAFANGLGSVAPMIIPGAMAATGVRGATVAGAVMGGATTGGAAANEIRQNVERLTDEQWAQIPAYQDAIAKGIDPGTARQKVANDAAQIGGALSAIAGAAGGAFNAKFLEDVIQKKGMAALLGNLSEKWAVRGGTAAAVGTVAEGFQEGLEKVGQNVGENIGLGKPALENATRDTLGDVAGGMMVGGAVGGAGGAISKPQRAAADVLSAGTIDESINTAMDAVSGKNEKTDTSNQRATGAGSNANAQQQATETPLPVQPVYVSPDVPVSKAGNPLDNELDSLARSEGTALAGKRRDIQAENLDAELKSLQKSESEDLAYRKRDIAQEAAKARDFEPAQAQQRDQTVERAEAITKAQGFGETEPTAMQLAMQKALGKKPVEFKGQQNEQSSNSANAAGAAQQQAEGAGDNRGILLPNSPGRTATPANQDQQANRGNAAVEGMAAAPVGNTAKTQTPNTQRATPEKSRGLDQSKPAAPEPSPLLPGDITFKDGRLFPSQKSAELYRKTNPKKIPKTATLQPVTENGKPAGFVWRKKPPTPAQARAREIAKKRAKTVDVNRDNVWTALTKLGGVNKQEFTSQFGLDPKANYNTFGAVEALRELGYRDIDGNELVEIAQLEEIFKEGDTHLHPRGQDRMARLSIEAQELAAERERMANRYPDGFLESAYDGISEEDQAAIENWLNIANSEADAFHFGEQAAKEFEAWEKERQAEYERHLDEFAAREAADQPEGGTAETAQGETSIPEVESEGQGGGVEGVRPTTQTKERRVDSERRKKVSEMTEAEKDKELHTDRLTGLKNDRWFEENVENYSHVIAFDADSLKWINDNMGHKSGDLMLRAWAEALNATTDTGTRYSGDEFFALANGLEVAQTIASKVEKILADAVVVAENGDEVNGIGVSFGIGVDRESADERLNQHKKEREAAGTRAGRGEAPPGFRRKPPTGEPDQGNPDQRQNDQVTETPEKSGVSVSGNPFKSDEEREAAIALMQERAKSIGFDGVDKAIRSAFEYGATTEEVEAVLADSDLRDIDQNLADLTDKAFERNGSKSKLGFGPKGAEETERARSASSPIDTRTDAEKTFDNSPEQALFNLTDKQLAAVANTAGMRQGKNSRIAFVEKLAGDPDLRPRLREAYRNTLEATNPETNPMQAAADALRAAADALVLTTQTPAEIQRQEESKKKAEADKTAADKKADAEEAKRIERDTVAQRNQQANDNFQLGQSAMDNLTGQGDLFSGNPQQNAQTTRDEPQSAEINKSEPSNADTKSRDGNRIQGVRAIIEAVYDGTADPNEFKAAYHDLIDHPAEAKAELMAKSKDELLKDLGGFFQSRYKNEKKARIIDAAYDYYVSGFALGKSYGPQSYFMGELDKYEAEKLKALTELVDGQTEESLKQFAAEQAKERDEAKAARAAKIASLENPQTLDEYRSALRAMMSQGKTFEQAYRSLTEEQRASYDLLEARESRPKRKVETPTVSAAGKTVGGQIIATKHTRDGYDLFVVQLAERVSPEDYKTLLSNAKRMGGWYSSFRGNGAIQGFQFKERSNAEAFLKLAAGDTSAAEQAVQNQRDAFVDDRSQTAVERLKEMAGRLDERADESLSQDRKTNTNRRAGMAARAEANANADKALASTMRNIAAAIENGKAEFLDRVRQKAQVEYLKGVMRTAKDNELRAKYQSYADQENHRGEAATAETVSFAEWPKYEMHRSDWAAFGRRLLDTDGFKAAGQQILKVADDMSEAYLDFARKNIFAVAGQFRKQSGELATFSSREDAERAISRSGHRGKAIVLPVKRGENRIILSPSEAMALGIWKGDGDPKIQLKADFIQDLMQKVGRRKDLEVPWQLETAIERRKMLARMGIETPQEFRSMLREFVSLNEAAKAPDKIKELERSMIGRQNDGLDFFPTPESVADELVEAAGVEPGMTVLEPSAGMGHIASRIKAAGFEPDVIEFSGKRRELLEAKGFNVVGDDFLEFKRDGNSVVDRSELTALEDHYDVRADTLSSVRQAISWFDKGDMKGAAALLGRAYRQAEFKPEAKAVIEDILRRLEGMAESKYDRIIMNPPFSDRRDIAHVRHAYDLLKPGGRLVAIMGEGSFFGSDKKATDFRDWLQSIGGTDEKLAEGSFMDPSLPVNTAVNARMVVINKPAGSLDANQDVAQYLGQYASTVQQLRTQGFQPDLFGPAGTLDVAKPNEPGIPGNLLAAGNVPPAVALKRTGEIRTGIDKITGPRDAAHVFAGMRKSPRELFDVLILDKDDKPISYVRLFGGTLTQTSVYPREIVLSAQATPGAKSIWIAHNHPSGEPTPSTADVSLTNHIGKLFGEELGIQPAGHVIISGSKATDYTELGGWSRNVFDIPARARTKTIPITERAYVRLLDSGKSIDSPDAAREVVQQAIPSGSGIVLLNAQNKLLATIPLGRGDMLKLRGTGGFERLMKTYSDYNPAAIIGVAEDDAMVKVLKNIGSASEMIDVRPLDIFKRYDGALFSMAEKGYDTTSGFGTFYSRRKVKPGTSIDTADAEAAVSVITKKWTNAPSIKVINHYTEAPKAVVSQIERAGAQDARGVYHDGRVYLIADRIADATEMERVLIHELRHFGFEGLFGRDMNPILMEIYLKDRAVREAANMLAKELNLSKVDAVNEVLADMPLDAAKKLPAWKRLVAKLKQWLNDHGFVNLAKLLEGPTADEVTKDILYRVERFIKSGERGENSLNQTMFHTTDDQSPRWYSALERAVEAMKVNAAPAAQWKNTIKNVPGVKPDEIEAIGLNDWLDTQGKLTKQQVLDFVRANGVQVTETMLGGPAETGEDKRRQELADMSEEDFADEVDEYLGIEVDGLDLGMDSEDRENLIDEIIREQQQADMSRLGDAAPSDVKFSQYQLPGGENYRELLLTLPAKDTITTERVQSPQGWGDTEGGNVGIVRRGDTGADFRSSHFDQPNIIAHIRFNERKDADGNRVLFIEEIQSDWAQQGRKQGFVGQFGAYKDLEKAAIDARQKMAESRAPALEAIKRNDILGFDTSAEVFDLFATHDDQYIRGAYEISDKDIAAIRQHVENRAATFRAEQLEDKARRGAIPSAPFVTKTEAWTALALKRMIRYASENGFDKVAWTNGEQQAARYDLSKRVDSVSWESTRTDGAAKNIELNLPNQNPIRLRVDGDGSVLAANGPGFIQFEGKNLDEVIGKDLAAKIMAEKSNGSLSGEGLRVGGKGMEDFYDKIVPNVANDVLKKLGGGKVEQVSLSTDSIPVATLGRTTGRYFVTQDGPTFDTREEANAWALEQVKSQPGFTITPELRAKVMRGGLPLFSRKSKQTDTPEFKAWFGDSKVVDDDGKPLVVYHGSPNDITAFNPEMTGTTSDAGYFGTGVYFAEDSQQAASYAKDGSVYPVYLSIKNPYSWEMPLTGRVMDGVRVFGIRALLPSNAAMRSSYGNNVLALMTKKGAQLPPKLHDAVLSRAGMTDADLGKWDALEMYKRGDRDYASTNDRMREDMRRLGDALRAELESRGYDGIVVDNPKLNGKRFREYVAFRPEQIKSAIGNRGTFDPKNPDIRFSRPTQSTLYQQLTSAKSTKDFTGRVASLLESDETFNRFLKHFNTQFHKATKDRDFKRVFDAVQGQMTDTEHYAIEAEAEAPNILIRMNGVRDIGRTILQGGKQYADDMKEIAKPLFANIEGVKGVGQFKYTDDELRKQWGLNDRQVGLYHEYLAAMSTSIERLAQAKILETAQALGMPIKAYKNWGLEDTHEIVRSAIFEAAEDKRVAATAKDVDPKMADKLAAEAHALLKIREQVDTIQKNARTLVNRGYTPAMRFGDYEVRATSGDENGEQTVEYMGRFESQAAANAMYQELQRENPDWNVTKGIVNPNAYRMLRGVSPESFELMAMLTGNEDDDSVKQYIALAKSSRAAEKRLLERKGIPGFSEDASRVLASFVTSNARASAIAVDSHDINEAMASPSLHAKGDVHAEAQKLVEYIANPNEEASKLRGLLFMHYMGGSIASGIVNLTQPILQTAPHLSKYLGAVDVAAVMRSAAKAAATGNVPDRLKSAMDRAEADGITEPHEIHQLMADASGSALGRSLRARAFVKAWGGFFSLSEAFNRKITFLAAYDTALRIGDAEVRKAGFKTAYDFAKDAVYQTQGIYSKANRPNLARGAVGATLFTFKQFSIAYLEWLSRLPAKQKAIALSLLFLASGFEGLPFAEDIEDLIDTIGHKLGYATNSRKQLRKAVASIVGKDAAEYIMKGSSRMTAIDLSGRLGMGNLIPGTAFFDPAQKDKAREILEAAGAAGGLAKGATAAWQGNPSEALPTAIKNLVKAYQMADTGQYRDSKGRLVQKVDGWDALVKAVGFQPTDVAETSTKMSEAMNDIEIARWAKDEIASKWVRGVVEKDIKAIREAKDALREWNSTNPEMPVIIKPADIDRRVKEARLTRDQRLIKTAPVSIRREVMADLR